MKPWNNRNLTQALKRWRRGDDKALEEMVEEIYPLCCDMVARRLGHRLTPTFTRGDLLHEVLSRLSGMRQRNIQNSAHLHNLIAGMMLSEISDHFRNRNAIKRGGGEVAQIFDESHMSPAKATYYEKLLVDQYINKLAEIDEPSAYMFVFRYLFGESVAEVALRYEVSESTVQRRIRDARVWLHSAINKEASE